MKNKLQRAAFLLTFAACWGASSNAQAQLMMDTAVDALAGNASHLNALTQLNANAPFIAERLKQTGYTNIRPAPTGANQYYATTPEGMNVLLTCDPTTGQIISAIPQ